MLQRMCKFKYNSKKTFLNAYKNRIFFNTAKQAHKNHCRFISISMLFPCLLRIAYMIIQVWHRIFSCIFVLQKKFKSPYKSPQFSTNFLSNVLICWTTLVYRQNDVQSRFSDIAYLTSNLTISIWFTFMK